MAIIRDAPNDHTRGQYDRDEMRLTLRERGPGAPWTRMETEIFDAITRYNDRPHRAPLFTRRLEIVSKMLAVFDAAMKEDR